MSSLLPLRSLGDFVIDSSIIKYNADKLKFNRVILPGYLGFLRSLVTSQNLKLDVLPLDVKSNVLSLFTNKYLFSKHASGEVKKLRKELQSLEVKEDHFFLQEHDFRNGLLSVILNARMQAPFSRDGNVYERRLDLYTGQKDFIVYLPKATQINHVVIFPDSRLKRKELNKNVLDSICSYLKSRNINYSIALYQKEQNDNVVQGVIKYYSNLEGLKNLIQMSDFIISCDSMPLHLSYYLEKEHFCIYNNRVNYEWLTPQIKNKNAYCLSDQLKYLYDYMEMKS